jgi:hypothetical protein
VGGLFVPDGMNYTKPLYECKYPRRNKLTPQDAMQYFGSQNKMAAAFGVTPPAVLRWRKAGRFPKRREYELPLAIERHRTKQEAITAAQKAVGYVGQG